MSGEIKTLTSVNVFLHRLISGSYSGKAKNMPLTAIESKHPSTKTMKKSKKDTHKINVFMKLIVSIVIEHFSPIVIIKY